MGSQRVGHDLVTQQQPYLVPGCTFDVMTHGIHQFWKI